MLNASGFDLWSGLHGWRRVRSAVQLLLQAVSSFCKREAPAVALLELTDLAALPWEQQAAKVFDDDSQPEI